jgi:hypothetical protein
MHTCTLFKCLQGKYIYQKYVSWFFINSLAS